MSPRERTPDQQRERARAIWANEGQPMMQARITDTQPKYLYRIAANLGFRKQRQGSHRGQYVTGPCIECLIPHQRDRIDRDYLCPACAREEPTRAKPLAVKPGPRIVVDIEREREQSRKRMQERFAGQRPNLGQPRTPVSRILKNERLG